jgi:hypothetical protein
VIDLQTQLAQYGDLHDQEQDPITLFEILNSDTGQAVTPAAFDKDRSTRSSRPETARHPMGEVVLSMPRPWAAVVAAILVVFLLGVIPLWLIGGGTDPVDDPTPQPTTTLAETEPGEGPAIEPTDLDMSSTSAGVLRWTRVSGSEETLPIGFIESDPDGGGYLVHDVDGAVWRSPDGLTWTRDDTAPKRDPSEWIAPFVSEDGVGWSLPEVLFPDGARIFETDFGWVAEHDPQGAHVFAISTDGESWEEVRGPPGPHIPPGGGISNVGAVGDLLYLLVSENSGSRTLWIGKLHDIEFQPPAAWPVIEPTDLDSSATSLGVLRWTRVRGDAETLPGGPIKADATGGYLARESDGVVWRSTDGLHWESDTDLGQATRDGQTGPGSDAGLPSVSEEADGSTGVTWGFAGVFETNFGLVRTFMPQSSAQIKVSRDGEAWEAVSGPPGPHDASGAGLSMVGAAGDLIWVLVIEETGPRTLWVGTFAD